MATLKVVNATTGIFTVKSETNDCDYAVRFVSAGDKCIPSCECMDWQRFYLPCKHILCIMQKIKGWNCEQLPVQYRKSPYLTLYSEVIFKGIDYAGGAISIDDDNDLNSTLSKSCLNNTVTEGECASETPKKLYPKRSLVTRCCDLLANIKNFVHECTSVTGLTQDTLTSAIRDLEDESESVCGINLSAPAKPTNKRKRRNDTSISMLNIVSKSKSM